MTRMTGFAATLAMAAAAPGGAQTAMHDAATFFKTTDYAIADSRRAYAADGSRLLLTANPTGCSTPWSSTSRPAPSGP